MFIFSNAFFKYKFFSVLLIIFVVISCLNKKTKKSIHLINNDLEKDISYFLCNILIFQSDFNCNKEIFININFFDEYLSIKNEFNLLIYGKDTKIENLLILIIIIPFIKMNLKLRYKINEKKFIAIFGNLFSYTLMKGNIIMQLNSYDSFENKRKLINLLNYDWEIIPSKNIINILRYVINHFYANSSISAFDKLLNMNFKKYISINLYKLNETIKNELISKKYYLISLK